MIVVMRPDATAEQIQHMSDRIRELGLEGHVIRGTERTVIAAVGDERGKSRETLEAVPGVEKVVPILAPYKTASREFKGEPTVVKLGPGSIGGKAVGVIAGPCSVEDRSMLLELAHVAKENGCIGLRGGAFKPRTSPYSFQGLGEEGLKYLAEAREKTGLGIVTEVLAPEHVPLVARYADVLQIGARNMQNFVLLSAAGKSGKPVLLKRGLSATLEEFLLAAEYVMREGNPNVMLCERGIRTFETYVRFTLTLSIVPELQRLTHLPVVIDPSQGTGHAHLVEPMSRAAVACGADGLIIEMHGSPEDALTDGNQSITPAQLETLMKSCRRVAAAVDREM
jgi:3-deoxy-7-phosphoheptulonate synthase